MTLRIGNVYHVYVERFEKNKFLMCVSTNPPLFFSINKLNRAGYLEFSNADCGCLRFAKNFLNCATIINGSHLDLANLQHRGRMAEKLVRRIIEYVENSDVLSQAEKKMILPEARVAYPKDA
jgi:hypothetical protein